VEFHLVNKSASVTNFQAYSGPPAELKDAPTHADLEEYVVEFGLLNEGVSRNGTILDPAIVASLASKGQIDPAKLSQFVDSINAR
jgi:hypothetical protein